MTDSTPGDLGERQTIATIEHEFRLVTEAIGLVASGHYPSVTLAGIRFGDQILDEARREAAASGVRIRRLFPADDSGADLIVERLSVAEEA
jgi:hypothetical protein